LRGANYGWPNCEGECVGSQTAFVDPIFQYGHGQLPTNGCAITGGTFYNPAAAQFPAEYRGSYFFSDICGSWIRRLDFQNGQAVIDFASNADGPIDLKVSAEGRLYYLARDAGAVRMITYNGSAPALGISRDDSDVSILWPAPSTGYALQTAEGWSSSALWTAVATPVLTTNGQNRVSVPITGQPQFFRLSK